jgi:hypothetical protein
MHLHYFLVEVHFVNNVFFLIMVRSSSMCVFMHLHCFLVEVHFINNVYFLIMVRSSSVCVFMHLHYCLVEVHFNNNVFFLIMVHSSSVCVCVHASTLLPGGGALHQQQRALPHRGAQARACVFGKAVPIFEESLLWFCMCG